MDDLNFNISNNWNAAEFILHAKVQSDISRLLLEGGPGQGKSTISQFICQVHRVRLLENKNDIKLLKKSILETPIRLPFKIDLSVIQTNALPTKCRLNTEIIMICMQS